jgi:hypothetical protein
LLLILATTLLEIHALAVNSPAPSSLASIKLYIIPRPHKIQDSQPIQMSLLGRRSSYATDARFQEPIRKNLQPIRNIHSQRLPIRLDILPFPTRCPYLSCRNNSVKDPKSVCLFNQLLSKAAIYSGVRAWYFIYRI